MRGEATPDETERVRNEINRPGSPLDEWVSQINQFNPRTWERVIPSWAKKPVTHGERDYRRLVEFVEAEVSGFDDLSSFTFGLDQAVRRDDLSQKFLTSRLSRAEWITVAQRAKEYVEQNFPDIYERFVAATNRRKR